MAFGACRTTGCFFHRFAPGFHRFSIVFFCFGLRFSGRFLKTIEGSFAPMMLSSLPFPGFATSWGGTFVSRSHFCQLLCIRERALRFNGLWETNCHVGVFLRMFALFFCCFSQRAETCIKSGWTTTERS